MVSPATYYPQTFSEVIVPGSNQAMVADNQKLMVFPATLSTSTSTSTTLLIAAHVIENGSIVNHVP